MSLTARVILKGLCKNLEYSKSVLPFLSIQYFEGSDREVFKLIQKFATKYNDVPTEDALSVMVENSDLPEKMFDEVVETLDDILNENPTDVTNMKWLMDETESFCRDRSIFNAINNAIQIYDGGIDKPRSAIPQMIAEALAVDFNNNIGHDYFDSAEEQLRYYQDDEVKFKFDIETLNAVTNGGVPNGTLNIFLAGINVGKSIFLIHQAAHWLAQGKNVLVISAEMSEQAMRHRVDANLFQMPMDDVERMARNNPETYLGRIADIGRKTQGKLKVKQYPTGKCHTGHIRALLNELELKQGFVPDMIAVDYIGIMASETMTSKLNSNTYYTQVAVELRALAVEMDVPIWTAHQLTRDKQSASDVDLDGVADAIGISATADFMLVGINNEELEDNNQLLMKQIKNRYNQKNTLRRFIVGLDRAMMTYFNINNETLNGQSDATNKSYNEETAVDSAISKVQEKLMKKTVSLADDAPIAAEDFKF